MDRFLSFDEDPRADHKCRCRVRDVSMSFAEVLEQERDCIENLRSARQIENTEGDSERFSIAFSGGGMRAAAFQAGVLWRLAKANKLKDVDYLAAVSGGGYVASSFASHCLSNGQPPQEADGVRTFYLNVVAKMLCRMQANAGNFVRDCVKEPCYSQEGSGFLPRLFDLPLLLTTLTATIWLHPLLFVMVILVPGTLTMEVFFGAGMRAVFCHPDETRLGFDLLSKWSNLNDYFVQFAVLAGSTVVFWILGQCCCCKLRPRGTEQRPEAPCLYLWSHSMNALCVRLTLAYAVFIIFVILVLVLQKTSYDDKTRLHYCKEYVHHAINGIIPPFGSHSAIVGCSDMYDGQKWYSDPVFANWTKNGSKAPDLNLGTSAAQDGIIAANVFGIMEGLFMILGVMLICSCCFAPYVGNQYIGLVARLFGPLLLFVAQISFVQLAIFGPVTRNARGIFRYDGAKSDAFVSFSLIAAAVLVPFYQELRAIFHRYYKRCLQTNFFAMGRDSRFHELASCAFCPFLILTVTSSDYQPPGDKDTISEISLTPLHMGGEETRYISMPEHMSLAKSAALSGAGALDAMSLSMSERKSMRFWLEVLNLSWGDYVLFERQNTPMLNAVRKILNPRLHSTARWCMRHLQACLGWMFVFLLMILGWHRMAEHDGERCWQAKLLFRAAIETVMIMIALCIFSFLPGLRVFAVQPLTRQFLQVTKYTFVGETPPRMLYMTDGGVTDCTALMQLMRRRCRRILLVLAAADASDDLAVLKAAMEVAAREKVGTFFNPSEPRQCVSILLEKFKEDKQMPHLHLGICYSWESEANGTVRTGELFIVKNRLPPSWEGKLVQPLLTESEVVGDESASGMAPRDGLISQNDDPTVDQLGPFGCCDCCHTCGHLNCGPKFPHGTFTGYLYLTPQWCNNLARLGYAASESAVEEMLAPVRSHEPSVAQAAPASHHMACSPVWQRATGQHLK